MSKYIHTEEIHNLDSPREIVPLVIDLLRPKSVVDIGCGLGTFLKCFKDCGVEEILGYDGPWVNKELLQKNIAMSEFRECDLEKEILFEKKYDLAVCLEVAEHLSQNASEAFVRNLICGGKNILFSAAVPYQGGQNHINEQWIDYWEKHFNKYNYLLHDVLRPLLWDNPNVYCWYKQNIVLFAPEGFVLPKDVPVNKLKNVIHPEMFMLKGAELDKLRKENEMIRNAKAGFFFYVKQAVKSVFKL